MITPGTPFLQGLYYLTKYNALSAQKKKPPRNLQKYVGRQKHGQQDRDIDGQSLMENGPAIQEKL